MNKIKELSDQIYYLHTEKDKKLTSEEILELSQKLDSLITAEMKKQIKKFKKDK